MINYYFNNEFDKENKYRPYTHELEANDDTLPPDNALRVAPPKKDGFIACEQNGKWVLVEDHRDSTVYDVNTQESSVVDSLGEIKEGFTLLKPFEFCKWNGEKWVLDEDAKNEATIKQNQSVITSLLAEANTEIEILNDKIELDIATDEDLNSLKKWKLYRINLKSIELNKIELNLPKKP